MAFTEPDAMRFYASCSATEDMMQRLVQMMDDLDDWLGVIGAASSYVYLLIIALSVMLVFVATLVLGPTGLFVALLVSGAAIGAATLQTRNH